MEVNVHFSGGLEMLFKNEKEHKIILPSQTEKWTTGGLILWLKENLLEGRDELFVQGKTVRPGILVLINNSDWELLGELEYEIQPGDDIVFISTLHGG